jgi:cytochrome c oxidase accessory protein FixG
MDVCFHCGDECTTTTIKHQNHCFCCYGCKTVFDILNENDLSYYYELETSPGSIPSKYDGKFDYLKNETIAQKLLEFDYLIGSDELLGYISDGPLKHQSTLISLLIFTAVFYFIFAWFREQVCIIVCPYGRLQGVLLDNKSIVVAYDHKRGEKEAGRAKFKKNEERPATGKGDCIDCFACVHVCPTGIDIRNGTQLECINCTACIDACDYMMEAVDLPKGLIRYDSEDAIEKKEKFSFTPRLKGYTAVLAIVTAVLIGMLFLRNDVEAQFLRLPGELYEHKENNIISNVYTYKIFNKTVADIDGIRFELLSHKGTIKLVSHSDFTIEKEKFAEGTLFIEINAAALTGDKDRLKIGIYSGDRLIETITTAFLGPRSYK